jgi:acyl-homoserine lactone synthase
MIRIIDQSNRSRYETSLDLMFRLRHTCFVKERGWREFEKDGIYEMDSYDNDAATYLAAVDDQDAVIGCIRLYPSTLPHMLSEVFPHLVTEEFPRGDQIIEMSRMAIETGRRGKQVYCELLIAMQEYSLERGLTSITALIRHARMPIVLAAGYQLRQLGPVTEVDNDPVVAVIFDVNDAVLARVKTYANVQHSVLEQDRGGIERQIA